MSKNLLHTDYIYVVLLNMQRVLDTGKALPEKQFVCMAVNSKCGINSPGNTRHHYRGNWL